MKLHLRLRAALRVATAHFGISLLVAFFAAALVFGLWYPFPYRELSGGRELFILVVTVDIICGPLLTLVLYNPIKPRAELVRDLGLVVLIQMAALLYGLWTVWMVRPLFMVNEFDRFKAVATADVRNFDFTKLPLSLQPSLWAGPILVGLRQPKDAQERQKVLFESVQGGADYAERPEFYLAYEGEVALNSLKKAKNASDFLKRYPEQADAIKKISAQAGLDFERVQYLPVMGRTDWIALLNKQGQIIGFVPGDGF
jgi:hypothetical protein